MGVIYGTVGNYKPGLALLAVAALVAAVYTAGTPGVERGVAD